MELARDTASCYVLQGLLGMFSCLELFDFVSRVIDSLNWFEAIEFVHFKGGLIASDNESGRKVINEGRF